jgi:flagellar L-ring protein precursor FlgH
MNGGQSVLRFAGVVNPADVQAGNVVASGDVVNARIELAGEGDISEAASRTWLQKVLTERLTIW